MKHTQINAFTKRMLGGRGDKKIKLKAPNAMDVSAVYRQSSLSTTEVQWQVLQQRVDIWEEQPRRMSAVAIPECTTKWLRCLALTSGIS